MSDQGSNSSDRLSESYTEGEVEGEMEGEMERNEEARDRDPPSLSKFSSSLRAVIRIRQKYQAMKKRHLKPVGFGELGSLAGAPSRTSPKIFTFEVGNAATGCCDPALPLLPNKKKKKRKRGRVLYPSSSGRRPPPCQDHSRAKNCLFLLCVIVFLQVYNAIENLDDHVQRYDLEGLDKTLRREVFGQKGAVEALLAHLRDYLSTYVHNKPLVLSLHGPTGVGKSHIGRLLAGHFRSVVGEPLVLQYYVLHHCPLESEAWSCARALSILISETVSRAEEEEKIPVFIFDEAEHMHAEILDALSDLVTSKRSNEYLNAVYVFLSNLGHAQITKHLLHNSSSLSAATTAAGRHGYLVKELTPTLRDTLEKLHPLWAEADLVPLSLLEKSHVMDCFLDEITREGFYPDHNNIERLAGEIEYYPPVGGRQYAQTGCKQVVAKVNLL